MSSILPKITANKQFYTTQNDNNMNENYGALDQTLFSNKMLKQEDTILTNHPQSIRLPQKFNSDIQQKNLRRGRMHTQKK
uniref:Putative ovule protein n=1 Tax=Solanum chacoense TaxID=4108 RepID=A0A0V0IMP3_SOLCH